MRSCWLPALAVSAFLVVGCDDDSAGDGTPTTAPLAPTPPAGKAKAKAKAKAEAVEAAPAAATDPLAAAKKAAWSGDAAAAATGFAAKVGEDDTAWSGLAAAARAMDDLTAATSALDGKGSVGERAILIAELKLAKGDAAGALASALDARADVPDAAAALVARAAKAGAELPEATVSDASDPVAALAAFVTARDLRAAKAVSEKANAVAGWRAAVLRGEALVGFGDTAAALQEFEKAAGSGDPVAVVAANIARARLGGTAKPQRGVDPITPLQVSTWAAAAASAAVTTSDPAQFAVASTSSQGRAPLLCATTSPRRSCSRPSRLLAVATAHRLACGWLLRPLRSMPGVPPSRSIS